MVAVLYVGVEVKGARRWVSLAGLSIQPSEFLKPAFVIICAWLFAEHARQPDIPGNLFAMILLGAGAWRCWSPSPISARPCWCSAPGA